MHDHHEHGQRKQVHLECALTFLRHVPLPSCQCKYHPLNNSKVVLVVGMHFCVWRIVLSPLYPTAVCIRTCLSIAVSRVRFMFHGYDTPCLVDFWHCQRSLTAAYTSTPPNDWQVIICSHAGRPKGEVVESMRIGNIGGCLGELLDVPVACPADCIGEKVEAQVRPIPLHHAGGCTQFMWMACPEVAEVQHPSSFSPISRFIALCPIVLSCSETVTVSQLEEGLLVCFGDSPADRQ